MTEHLREPYDEDQYKLFFTKDDLDKTYLAGWGWGFACGVLALAGTVLIALYLTPLK